MKTLNIAKFSYGIVLTTALLIILTGCSSGGGSDSVTVEGDVPIAYVKRPVATLGNPTDSVMFSAGGDLYIREKSSPSAPEINVTGDYTQGRGDVSDPEVSYDGAKILFAMRGPNDRNWGIWEHVIASKQLRRLSCDAASTGDDVDPAYLPDGRIVFVSSRQEGTKRLMQAQGITPYTYVDEYEREAVTALHVMDADGKNCRQISFNQSHDRNPTVLQTGEIMFSRWDHVGGRNQFSIFKINPDGTNPFIVYGAHGPGNSYLHPREMPDGRVVSTLMPLSGTREGGSLEIIDITHYSDINSPGTASPPANQLGESAGQFQATRLLFSDRPQAVHDALRGRGVSELGRYSAPYPMWDGTGRLLTVFTTSQPVTRPNALGQSEEAEGAPKYGIYMFDLSAKTLRPVVLPQDGYHFSDPVALMARPRPQTKGAFTPDTSIGAGFGLLDVNTVYDTDNQQRMGNAVLVSGVESIPRVSGRPDIASLKRPGTLTFENRVARFFRITKAVPTPRGLSRETIGETEFEMQQIVGYGTIEPDGSIRTRVPSDTPIAITALDKDGRAFTPHTNWIQAREGERRFCKGCHSSRLSTTNSSDGLALNDPVQIGIHPSGDATSTMARTRTAVLETSALDLKRDLVSQDVWTRLYNSRDGTNYSAQDTISITYSGLTTAPAIKGPASCATTWSSKDCAIAINYEDHIQPIWSAKCASCHQGTSAAAGLDLSDTRSGEFGRLTSYQELLVGDPLTNPPQVAINANGEVRIAREAAAVEDGSARASRLIERLFEQPLKAAALTGSLRAVCRAAGASCVNGATYQNHAGLLSASERRLVTEWIDIGAQYYNDPFDSAGKVRSTTAQLNETAFGNCIQPILQQSCASCHQPFAGSDTSANVGASGNTANTLFTANRFILTNNSAADFSVTASMVTNLAVPDNSYLLSRLSSDPPHASGLLTTANRNIVRAWIANTLNASTCSP
jgi:hypothetical protein